MRRGPHCRFSSVSSWSDPHQTVAASDPDDRNAQVGKRGNGMDDEKDFQPSMHPLLSFPKGGYVKVH